jgi:hypothetical protein
MDLNEKFEDWFHELEGFSFRSERAIDDLFYASETNNVEMIRQWMYAAFEAGYGVNNDKL